MPARRFHLGTLRSRLFLTVLAAATPGFVAGSYRAVEQFTTTRDRATETARQAVQMAVRQNTELAAFTRLVLQQAAQTTDVNSACSNLRAMFDRQQEVRFAIGVANTAEQVVCIAGNGPYLPPELPPGAREALVRARKAASFALGPYDVAPDRNESRLTAAAPLGADHYVFAVVPLDWFGDLSEELDLPPESTLTILHRNGMILARYPDPQHWAGQVVRGGQLLSLLNTVTGVDAGAVVGLDGVHRLYAFAKLEHDALEDPYVAVGIPSSQAFREARQALFATVFVMIGAGLLGVCVSWAVAERFVLRRSTALTSAARRLASGDLAARVPETDDARNDMGELSRTFNEMATSLERAHENEEQRYSELLEQRHRLNLLSRELLRVQEKERQHIARELHDQIGQNLTALKINLQLERSSERASPVVEESVILVDRILSEVRELSLALRPPLLAELGLSGALTHLIRSEAERAGLHVETRIEIGDARLDAEIELVVFRIAQEALTNVVRHAEATHLTVVLDKAEGALQLSIADDGIGFDVRRAPGEPRSFGLLGMNERAVLAGATLAIDSTPGAGTTVRLRVPMTTAIT